MNAKKTKKQMLLILIGLILLLFVYVICASKQDKFVRTGDMNIPRSGHRATLLNDGRVLITGDSQAAELYNPKTGKFTLTGKMNEYRIFHSSTLLKDGTVLLTGGVKGMKKVKGHEFSTQEIISSSAEVYDPKTEKFNNVGNMNTERKRHESILLPNGKVLIIGGFKWYIDEKNIKRAKLIKTVELYNPLTKVFKIVGNTKIDHYGDKLILLKQGKVLIAGGRLNAEIYDYKAHNSKLTAKISTDKNKSDYSLGTPILLKNRDHILFLDSRYLGLNSPNAHLYRVNKNEFKKLNSMNYSRSNFTATLLKNGKVLITGGYSGHNIASKVLKNSEVYNPKNETFIKHSNMNFKRESHNATLLKNGNVLVTGGSSGKKKYKKSEIYIVN